MNHATCEDKKIPGFELGGPKRADSVLQEEVRLPTESRDFVDDGPVRTDHDGKTRSIYAAIHERQPHRKTELWIDAGRVTGDAEVFVLVVGDARRDMLVTDGGRQDSTEKEVPRAFELPVPAKDGLRQLLQIAGVCGALERVRAHVCRRNVALLKERIELSLHVTVRIRLFSAQAEFSHSVSINRASNEERFACVQAIANGVETVGGGKDRTHKRGAPGV